MTHSSVNAAKRIVPIDGVINFRDLGGYPNQIGQTVKWGKCYRSAQFDRMSEQGVVQLSNLNIQTVIDLRFADEIKQYPSNVRAFVKAGFLRWEDVSHDVHISQRSSDMQMSWKDSLDSYDPKQVREAMRINYPKKLYSHQAIYRAMLLKLINDETPLVFHCAAGKDRTGVAAALLLSLLGVSNELIIEDYLISQAQIQSLAEYWMAGGAINEDKVSDFQAKLLSYPNEVIAPIFTADEAYIKTLLEYVAKTYGNFTNYAHKVLKLTETQQAQLREQMLEQP